jgi:hypothetical protein
MPVDSAAANDVRATSARTKRMIALLAAIAIAPVVLAYLAYYVFPRDARVNYGDLLPHTTIPAIAGTRADGQPFDVRDLRGRWIVLYQSPATCNDACAAALYAGRQSRTIQNAERERVVRVWLTTGGEPAPALVAEHPDLEVVRVTTPPALPHGANHIYLVDPLGNFVLAWPANPDIKAMAKDLTRLLHASSIG